MFNVIIQFVLFTYCSLISADKVYTFKNASVSAIKKEIFFRGPVTAEILVHEDFECYKSGGC